MYLQDHGNDTTYFETIYGTTKKRKSEGKLEST